jgi:nucleoid DNA-binding protein
MLSRLQRAEARRVQHLEKVQIAIDGFGAFKVKHHRERCAVDRRARFRGRLADRHVPL